jgi:hypothetical protein
LGLRHLIPGKEWANGKIELFTDSLGNPDPMMDVVGIPPCNSNPEGCAYSITPGRAKEIALNNGIKPGIKELSAKFTWSVSRGNYVWQVLSVTSESQGSFGFRGSGQEMLIDASTGEVLSLSDWNVR